MKRTAEQRAQIRKEYEQAIKRAKKYLGSNTSDLAIEVYKWYYDGADHQPAAELINSVCQAYMKDGAESLRQDGYTEEEILDYAWVDDREYVLDILIGMGYNAKTF